MVAMFVNAKGLQRRRFFLAIFIEDLPMMLPTKFRSTLQSGFRGEDFFRNHPIRNKNCLWWPCLLTDQDEISNLYRGPSNDDSYQVSIHLAKRFQRRRIFRNQLIRNKNCLWQPMCVNITDRDKMSNFIEDLP